jgi:hypothetical protein
MMSEKLKLKDKAHMGTYFAQNRRKEFKKTSAHEIAFMGQKMISFGTVMMTMTMKKAMENKMLWVYNLCFQLASFI